MLRPRNCSFRKCRTRFTIPSMGHTAAELIVERADSRKEHMGLTTWENAPHGKIVKPDVSIAKNYLNEIELEDMGRLVNAVLDMAERMARRHIPMTMGDWANRTNCSNRISIDSAILFCNFGMISKKSYPLRIEYGQPIMHGCPYFRL